MSLVFGLSSVPCVSVLCDRVLALANRRLRADRGPPWPQTAKCSLADTRSSLVEGLAIKMALYCGWLLHRHARYVGPRHQGRRISAPLRGAGSRPMAICTAAAVAPHRSRRDPLARRFSRSSAARQGCAAGRRHHQHSDWHERAAEEKRLPTRVTRSISPVNRWCWCAAARICAQLGRARQVGITKQTQNRQQVARSARMKMAAQRRAVDNARTLVSHRRCARPPSTTCSPPRHAQFLRITSVRVTAASGGRVLPHTRSRAGGAQTRSPHAAPHVYLPPPRRCPPGDPASVREILSRRRLSRTKATNGCASGRQGSASTAASRRFMTQPSSAPWAATAPISSIPCRGGGLRSRSRPRASTRMAGASPRTRRDAAIDVVWASYEAANADRSIAGRRWAIEHLFVVTPDQIARSRSSMSCWSVQDHPISRRRR